MLNKTLTVNQLNCYVKSLIENDIHLRIVSVTGEISNFKNHFASGHWYFTLKDSDASIRCVMFRASAVRVRFSPKDGMAVTLRGRVSLYEKDGQYQFYAEEMHDIGEGDLALAFKQTKEKLEAEGLFNTQSKRPLVKYPRRIAVVTSDTGAAVRDIINIIDKRFPACEVLLCPVNVQGEYAVPSIVSVLDRVYALQDIDTVIIGRGGGSAEDLQAFNSEILARKIYESPFPVISAVGHETDFTICDFVADVRASTPSHAAELATPDTTNLLNEIIDIKRLIKNRLNLKYELSAATLKALVSGSALSSPQDIFDKRQLLLDGLTDKMLNHINNKISAAEVSAQRQMARIDSLSPLKTMSRGFSVALSEGKTLTSAYETAVGDRLNIRFKDGEITCEVIDAPERK